MLEERPYPCARLNQGWEGLIYPDHGWCGEKTLETIRVFHERLQTAHDVGKEVYESSLGYIARRVQRNKQAGTALIVFNPLSWKRTGPVSSAICFHRGECQPDGPGRRRRARVSGAVPVPRGKQLLGRQRARGDRRFYRRRRSLDRLQDVLLVAHAPGRLRRRRDQGQDVVENRFYRIKLGERGIASLIDKESGAEVFDTQKIPGQ